MRRLAALALISSFACFAAPINYFTEVRAIVDQEWNEQVFENDPDLKISTATTATGYSEARAQIAPGIQRAFVHFESPDENNPAEFMVADARTHWTDEITISDPELNGTLGTFTASVRVEGTASFNLTGAYTTGEYLPDADVYGFWDTWIGTSTDGGGSFLVGGWFGSWYSDIGGEIWYEGDELNNPLTEVTLEFIYGQPFLLRANMEAYFDADNYYLLPGTVEGTLDFSHTTYWNGISGFYDANGNPVNPEFSSASGIDWRNAVVPEPASLAVLGLGLALLRKRRSR